MPATLGMILHRESILPVSLVVAFLVATVIGGDWSPWVDAVLGILTLLLVIFSRHAHPLAGGWRSPTVWFLATFALAALTAVWSQQHYASVRNLTYLFIGFTTFIAAREIPGPYVPNVLRWVFVGGAGSAAWALVSQFTEGADRAGGLLGNANALGAFLALVLPVGVAVALGSSRRWRIVSWFGVGVIAVALLRTYSYTAWFGLGLAAIIGIVIAGRRVVNVRRVVWSLGILLVLLGGVVGLRSVQLKSFQAGIRLDQVISGEHFRSSFSQRWHFAQSAVDMLIDRPFTGVGLGAYQISYPRYARTLFEQPRYTHNAYLEIAAEAGGLVALAFVGGFIILAMRVAERFRDLNADQRHLAWLSVAIGGSAIAAAVDFGWHFPAVWVAFFILAGLLAGPTTAPNRRAGFAVTSVMVVIALIVFVRGLGVAYAWTYFERADRALAHGEAESAVQTYAQGLRYDPDPTRRNQLAEALWVSAPGDAGALQRAREQLHRALAWAPTNYFTYRLLGRVEYSDRRYADAEHAFQKAVTYDNAFHLDIAGEYANFLISQKRLADAVAVVDKALAAYPEGSWSANPAYATDIVNMQTLRAGIQKQLQAQ